MGLHQARTVFRRDDLKSRRRNAQNAKRKPTNKTGGIDFLHERIDWYRDVMSRRRFPSI